MNRQVTGTVVQIARGLNSKNGNPSWRLMLDTGATIRTRTDTGDACKVSDYIVGKAVTLTLDGRGQAYAINVHEGN